MTNNILGTVADVLGILGFIATLFIWYLTGKMSRKFIRRARVPQLRGDLSQLSGDLLIALKPRNIDNVGGVLSRIESSLDSAADKVSFWSRGDIRKLRRKIKVVRLENVFEESRIRPLHNEVLGVIEVLKNIEKDNSWESVE